ncbi:uncharacterized protein TNCV_2502851 [Trichonephila clavipes]|nr:uncharacterized protein TNCV_2502851 [Trichonephila clavipes]
MPFDFSGVMTNRVFMKGLNYRTLDRNFYVDDLISGDNEFEEALQTSRRAKNIMEAAGMDLRKWITNDANLMEQWKKENFNVHPVHETQVVPELNYLTEHQKETVVQERKKLPEADRSEETVMLNNDSSSILDELLELSNNLFQSYNAMLMAASHQLLIFCLIFSDSITTVGISPKRAIGNLHFTFEEFETIMIQVEGLLNSRPLTLLSSDADNFDVFTPGHFLIGRPITSIPEPHLIDVNENRLSRWEKITKVVQRTWKKWKSDYLNTLQARSK